jgi:hypothetical protein
MLKLNKSLPAGLASAVALALSSQAFAEAPTAELKVTGMLEVPGCTVTVADDGVYDFGHIAPSTIKPGTTTTALTAMDKTWDIACTGTTFLTFKVIDNQAASTSGTPASQFGLGNVNGTGKLGYYGVVMKNATVDGNASNVFASTSTTIAGTAAVSLNAGSTMGWSTGTALSPGKDFAATMTVSPTLAGTTTMNGPVTEDTDLNGSLTLNFAFGL